ncbi:MurR/RpiR family transcriptional regulator [Streptomyces sp. NBC_01016]|uniref:MurR/RpiR family transcriptional regulator n=1 Tax=Streptomyces sp. NBC_01016 TaxID=2903720 RepID=UPI002250CD75|nr:MurR/RpiR family transcriptional regulator [Streptomyces sp. NBC_01016]MCX4831809.1 MurR/RpiR family transcriptional regulator [Streptomyces sp. NBC_01016]
MGRPTTRTDSNESAGEPSGDILVRIRSALPALAPAEQRVAEAIIEDPAQASRWSIGVLADRARTSVTTVMRFCRTNGLRSYPELRLALAGAVALENAQSQPRTHSHTDISETDTLDEIADKIVFHEARGLEETRAQLDIDVLKRVVEAVGGARRIDIFGVGASGFVAADLHQKLHRIGLMAFVWTDAHAALTATALLRPGDVALGISHSGTTADTLDPLQAAAERGATTVALTNFPRSPLAESADLVLTTSVREMPLRSGATVSRTAQLAVVDCLFVGVAQRCYDHSATALNDTFKAIHRRSVPYTAARRSTPDAPSVPAQDASPRGGSDQGGVPD